MLLYKHILLVFFLAVFLGRVSKIGVFLGGFLLEFFWGVFLGRVSKIGVSLGCFLPTKHLNQKKHLPNYHCPHPNPKNQKIQ